MCQATILLIKSIPSPKDFTDFHAIVLELARKKFPGSKNNLNALCRRFGVSLESRETHGALTDSFLLLQVYNELLGGKQQKLDLNLQRHSIQSKKISTPLKQNLKIASLSNIEAEEHKKMLNGLKNNFWK